MENIIVVALKAIIVSNKKVLIIQRSKDDEIGANTWEFVGGKLSFGEDLAEGLKREVREEVGLDINIEKVLYTATFKPNPQKQVVILAYLCHTNDNNIKLSYEHENYLWANKKQLLEMLPQAIINDLNENSVFDVIDIY